MQPLDLAATMVVATKSSPCYHKATALSFRDPYYRNAVTRLGGNHGGWHQVPYQSLA